ncbi:MAG TPA: 3D-(3,5/4)-trihydroxycyclohexane-1,2-dione acylhydrolase (decyclizing) [Acetobacteraceae bacterium]|jgi:3D-(3,5/4)-trihydroxycyclohexane-1,2-dione acylhydrolase (decyclizing)|nr:3D-(3,5/4)-trihydroxycyclohexane-1,2-dione acylhydrolase (decyclizing) [Acetobacteraceae bacterium]
MATIRLTAAQALVRYLAAQRGELGDREVALFAGVWAIFGHGNVAALGEALYEAREALPTFRSHNEQAMGHAAIGFAKACRRRRMMACTSSIGPGASNMVTAAAVAHVDRLPVLFLPGDVFASRRPDPVLQQLEHWGDATVSVNDCFRPVSRYFDRIARPEQLLTALPRAMAVLTDPAECGPVTLALCQDTQAEAFDWPAAFFAPRVWRPRRPPPDAGELGAAVAALRAARTPVIVAGGGVLYSEAADALVRFAQAHGVPVTETQAGKGALAYDHALNLGAIGVTGTAAANRAAAAADVVLAVGTRLQDFTTGSRTLFGGWIIGLNVQQFDASKHDALPLVADAREGLAALDTALGAYRSPTAWTDAAAGWRADWQTQADAATAPSNAAPPTATPPTDAQVIGAVQRAAPRGAVVVCAAGGLPGELHKLWQAEGPGSYHLEYGYSCMGYEIAGGLGVKLADPSREVIVMVGDGSYLMLNSEIATSVMLGLRLTIVLLDNGGFGCIDRLQRASGGAGFNNLLADAHRGDAHQGKLPAIDFRAHAASLGAIAQQVDDLAALEDAVRRAHTAPRTTVIVIATDPRAGTQAGGHWWDVAVPAVSSREQVRAARSAYERALAVRDAGD